MTASSDTGSLAATFPASDIADAHVIAATKAFRDVGFTLAAMQYPRPADALVALREFNGVPATWVEPFGWRYFPNEWCRDNWRALYRATPSEADHG